MPEKYFGKYRGTVINNVDPLRKGRLMVQVPDVLGVSVSSWALPCAPMAGPQAGVYLVPTVGAGVWVEFEGGDRDYPIWVGGFWGSAAEVPSTASAVTPGMPVIALQTPTQNALMISDVPVPPVLLAGGIVLKSGASTLTVDTTGVKITAPRVEINGVTIVMNNGALTIV